MTNPSLFDVDANFSHPDLVDDVEASIRSAIDVGVTRFVVPGSSIEASKKAIELAKTHAPYVLATVGIHPYSASESVDDLSKLYDETFVAYGEMGLDSSAGFPLMEIQERTFREQLHAISLRKDSKPLFLHERKAFLRFTSALDEFLRRDLDARRSIIIHCFTGTPTEAKYYASRGFYLSFSGSILSTSPKRVDATLKSVPLDRILIETDAPYLGFPGCRANERERTTDVRPNASSALPFVCARLATGLGLSFEETARLTTQNAMRVFRV